ncbi:Cupin domain-containing protein [Flavobacterium swingsii]|jgi:mannose-6-phosphate isomerase-like protein (cupin superfamily)|uniref:Cupin domain-containing protein n=1 Tax=Flavobacterium swingsii TaxID=498292 RepID=A0A1I0Y779_9FLAO|nr:cupin domain-containing protein [Flavobacterium swingsii]SFB09131.1 Cupin domain-containing protein [Flavobacterium swingsii]
MDTIQNYINSGILELYVLGMTTDEENIEITKFAEENIEIKEEIDSISKALQITSEAFAPEISPASKAMIMATIDYTERLKNGEEYAIAPLLNKNSTVADFKTWINRPNMQVSEDYETIDAKIISASEEATTLIVWLKHGAPIEVHDKEYEHFLIVEGSCTITIGEEAHDLVAGSYLSIPLFIGHSVAVTSDIACKIILQRVAA